VSHLVEIFRELRRVLRKDGTFWLNLGDSYWGGKGASNYAFQQRRTSPTLAKDYHNITGMGETRPQDGHHEIIKSKDLIGIPWMTAFALRADGWYLRQDIVWAKKNCMPESITDRCTKSHEFIFLLAKSKIYYYDNEAIKEPQSELMLKIHSQRGGIQARSVGKYSDGSGRQDGGYRGCSNNINVDKCRNKRDVWTISTRPYRGAHFAVFPTALVEPPILAGTSEKGCCKKCGSPWERVMERGLDPTAIPLSERPESGRTQPGNATVKPGSMGPGCKSRTVGWKPTCDCNAGDPVPCTVLDPFGGSGTTGEVAERLGRNSILIELNPSYVELAKRRTIKRVPVLPGDSWTEPVTRV
jgi:DNA modification methylase